MKKLLMAVSLVVSGCSTSPAPVDYSSYPEYVQVVAEYAVSVESGDAYTIPLSFEGDDSFMCGTVVALGCYRYPPSLITLPGNCQVPATPAIYVECVDSYYHEVFHSFYPYLPGGGEDRARAVGAIAVKYNWKLPWIIGLSNVDLSL